MPVVIGGQSAQADFDVLGAKANNNGTGYTKTSHKTTAVALEFEHKLAKIVMNVVKPSLTTDSGLTDGDLANMTLDMTGMKTRNTFSLATGLLGTATDVAASTPRKATTNADFLATYDAIIMPGTYNNGDIKVVFTTTDGEPFTWTVNGTNGASNVVFDGGNEYTYDVTLTRTGVKVEGPIKPWKEIDRGDVTAE